MKPFRFSRLYAAFVLLACLASAWAEENKDSESASKLKRLVSFEFVDTPVKSALKYLQNLSKLKFELDAKAIEAGKDRVPLDLHVENMELRSAAKWIAVLTEMECTINGDTLLFSLPAKEAEPPQPEAAASAGEKAEIEKIEKQLEREITFEFKETPFSDAIEFLRHLANVPFIVDPNVLKGNPDHLSLKVSNLSLKQALTQILDADKLSYVIRDQAIYIFEKPVAKN